MEGSLEMLIHNCHGKSYGYRFVEVWLVDRMGSQERSCRVGDLGQPLAVRPQPMEIITLRLS